MADIAALSVSPTFFPPTADFLKASIKSVVGCPLWMAGVFRAIVSQGGVDRNWRQNLREARREARLPAADSCGSSVHKPAAAAGLRASLLLLPSDSPAAE